MNREYCLLVLLVFVLLGLFLTGTYHIVNAPEWAALSIEAKLLSGILLAIILKPTGGS